MGRIKKIRMSERDDVNYHYRLNPPKMVIDDDGIRFCNEVPYPAKYKAAPCNCGKIHPVDSNTWYHSTLKMTHESYKVVKKCKDVMEFL